MMVLSHLTPGLGREYALAFAERGASVVGKCAQRPGVLARSVCSQSIAAVESEHRNWLTLTVHR